MTSSNLLPNSYRLNVLALDGGGVRGLSSLLILQDLMQLINISIQDGRRPGETHTDVAPHQVFDFVAGTSTGGLIAIMLGKLGMSLDECIEMYHQLSKTIFGKMHIRGKMTRGLACSKYSGTRLRKCVRKLIQSRGLGEDLPMVAANDCDRIACAVVCREQDYQDKYSDFKTEPVCICSLPCPDPLECLVCEAARATSAAPTFFPAQDIGSRRFVDGGMAFNNPTFAIFDHYTECDRAAVSRRGSVVPDAGSPIPRHGNLDFSRVRFVNLGTGTKTKRLPPLRRYKLVNLVPGLIRMAIFVKATLVKVAVDSENVAKQMETIAWTSRHNPELDVKFARFSADNGVCYIKLDGYKQLSQIKALTKEYLDNPETRKALSKVAREIGRDYLVKHRIEAGAVLTGDSLAINSPNAPRPQNPPIAVPTHPDSDSSFKPDSPGADNPPGPDNSPGSGHLPGSQTPPESNFPPGPDAHTPASTNSSSQYSKSSPRSGPSRETSTAASSIPLISSRETTNIALPAEPMIETSKTVIGSPGVQA